MDLSTLPDIVQHLPDILSNFSAVAGATMEHLQPVARMSGNVVRAFSDASPLTKAEKVYHGGKLAVLGLLASFCLATGNVEGFVGTMIGNVDEVRSLSLIGESAPPIKASKSPRRRAAGRQVKPG